MVVKDPNYGHLEAHLRRELPTGSGKFSRSLITPKNGTSLDLSAHLSSQLIDIMSENVYLQFLS